MKKEIISVIIPARNRVDFARQALNSVTNQQLHNNYKLEIILVDNDSNPPLKNILSNEFPQVRFFRYIRHHHPGASRNYGLKKANGQYVAFLDSDDIWNNNFLETSLEILNSVEGPATICLTNPLFTDPYPLGMKIKFLFLNLIWSVSLLLSWLINHGKLIASGFYLCQISHMLFRAKDIRGLLFNQTSIASEDWEFVSDVSRDKEIIIIPRPLAKFRYELKSNTNRPEVSQKKGLAYLELISKLPFSHKKGLFHHLLCLYIKTL